MLQLPPRPAKADAHVRAAFSAPDARNGAEQDPSSRAMQLRFLPQPADGADTPRQARDVAFKDLDARAAQKGSLPRMYAKLLRVIRKQSCDCA